MMFALTCTCTMAIIHLLVKRKGVFGQSIISIISADLSPFGANSVITFDLSLSIRWYTSIFENCIFFLEIRNLKNLLF